MATGAANGYTKTLQLVGTGYRAEVKGPVAQPLLGFSHPIAFQIPAGIKVEIPADSKGTLLVLTGADKEKMGQTAAKIRGFRPPEPYGGKGVRYQGEKVREKAGKAGKGGKRKEDVMAMQMRGRERRKLRIRRKISGSPERPRLTVFRSSKHIYAQVVDDRRARPSRTRRRSDARSARRLDDATKSDAAKKVGAAIAKLLLSKGIDKVVFDRNGYLYHGRVRALADAAREAGLKF